MINIPQAALLRSESLCFPREMTSAVSESCIVILEDKGVIRR